MIDFSNDEIHRKLNGFLRAKFKEVTEGTRIGSTNEFVAWFDYLEKHGCEGLEATSDELVRYWNNEKKGGMVCVKNPQPRSDHYRECLLLPREFAEKCLAMGGLP